MKKAIVILSLLWVWGAGILPAYGACGLLLDPKTKEGKDAALSSNLPEGYRIQHKGIWYQCRNSNWRKEELSDCKKSCMRKRKIPHLIIWEECQHLMDPRHKKQHEH
ncbi:MAG: hypothetical protein ACE5EK_04015, partial [Nitrospinales bacterium]